MLGDLTTALAATNARVDSLTTHAVQQVSIPVEQPSPSRPSAMENTPATTSTAKPDQASIEEQVQIQVAQHESILPIFPGHH